MSQTIGETPTPTVNPELVRQLVMKKGAPTNKNAKRCSREAASAASELLRLFIVEARSRASIEAECEVEGKIDGTQDDKTMIRADHITKIAAELLMDFS